MKAALYDRNGAARGFPQPHLARLPPKSPPPWPPER
jgi:hypothetical protein